MLGYFFVNMQNLGNLNKMVKGRDGVSWARVPPTDTSLEADTSLFLNTKNSWPCQTPP